MKKMLMVYAATTAVVVLMLTAATNIPVSVEPTPDSGFVSRETAYRVVGEWDGQVAVFLPHSTVPERVYDTVLVSLPEEEQRRLKNGIEVENDEALRQLLEDYLS